MRGNMGSDNGTDDTQTFTGGCIHVEEFSKASNELVIFDCFKLAKPVNKAQRKNDYSGLLIKGHPKKKKKEFHKHEEKMQKKMNMILQKDENLVHIQQQYSDSFFKKIDSKYAFL